MPISQQMLEAAELDRSTLTFKDAQLESHFREHDMVRLRRQARIALLVGGVLYGSYGLMDYLFIPSQDFIKALYLHVMALMIAFSVFALTYTPVFSRLNQPLLFIAGFFAGLGLLGKMNYLPPAAISLFYVGLIQITFWCHYFSGMRFIYSTAVGIFLLIIFNIMFSQLPSWTLFSYDFFIATANILGAFTSYTGEKQNRTLFLREKELDTERHLQHERALHDRLTGLPNRELLHDRIEQAIQYSIRNNQICAALFLDLDRFKPINDTYGHQIGDLVLQEAALRLSNATREVDTLCRLGGDEFFVLAQDINSLEAAEALALKLQEQIESPLNIPNLPASVTVSTSIGICLFPYPNASAIDVIRRADHAMYENKKRRKKALQQAHKKPDH